jgi:hypothetical protein
VLAHNKENSSQVMHGAIVGLGRSVYVLDVKSFKHREKEEKARK